MCQVFFVIFLNICQRRERAVTNRIYMVTSRSGEKKIQDYCARNSIYIIPKNFSFKIPLHIFSKKKNLVVLTSTCDREIPLLDKSKWHIYSNTNDFMSDIPYFEPSNEIYIRRDTHQKYIDNQLKSHGLYANKFEKISCLLDKKIIT